MKPRPVEDLNESDFEKHPVWEFVNDDALGETAVRPVKELPVSTLSGRLISTMVQFANKELRRALLGNVSVQRPDRNEHFLTVTVWCDGKSFFLARYFDSDYAEQGPKALAEFLGMKVAEVFPITYDLTEIARGNPAALTGEIPELPRKRLTVDDIIGMALKPDELKNLATSNSTSLPRQLPHRIKILRILLQQFVHHAGHEQQ